MIIALSAFVLILAAVVVALFARLRSVKNKVQQVSNLSFTPPVQAESVSPVATPEPEIVLPQRIEIGEHENQPVVSIELSENLSGYHRAAPISMSSGPVSRLSSMLQSVPSMLIAKGTSGKQLMEVIINGDLVRASDGNGLRAFTMGANGIKEHARLFDAKNLQHMINAAAVWQIASVLVAQKHLADISKKLEVIQIGIQDISYFLDSQRKARIQSSYEYLRQVSSALSSGELSPSVRNELESIERDLLEIQHHLEQEFRRKLEERVNDGDTFGTEDLTNNLLSKADRLKDLTQDMALCLQTRIAAWHVFSLYPGEPQLKRSRQETIQRSIDQLKELVPNISINLVYEASTIKSFWNKQSTLDERKAKVEAKADVTSDSFGKRLSLCYENLIYTSQVLIKHDQPMRVLLEVEDGQIMEARLAG